VQEKYMEVQEEVV